MATDDRPTPLRDRPPFYRHLGPLGGRGHKVPKGEPIKASFSRPWDQPSFVKSYLFSARLLLEQVHEEGARGVALPVLYLQRHAFELLLKELLDVAYGIAADRPWLRAMERADEEDKARETPTNRAASRVCQTTLPKSVRFIHDHGKLVEELRAALKAIKYSLPEDFCLMVESFASLEQGDETRFRYPQVKGRLPSLGDRFEAHLSNLQNQLETLVETHYEMSSMYDDPKAPGSGPSLHEELATEAERMSESIYRLGVDPSIWPLELDAKSQAQGLKAVSDVLEGWAFLEVKLHDDGSPRIEFDEVEGKIRVMLGVRPRPPAPMPDFDFAALLSSG